MDENQSTSSRHMAKERASRVHTEKNPFGQTTTKIYEEKETGMLRQLEQ